MTGEAEMAMQPALDLGSAEKVAALLLSLLATDRDVVAKILDKFDPDELALVTKAASRIGALPPVKVTQNILEFLDRLQEGPSIIGNERNSQVLLDTAAQHRREDSGPAGMMSVVQGSVWERCETLPVEILCARIASEPPQIAAFWLAHLKPALSSEIFSRLSVSEVSVLINRLAQIKSLKPEAVAFLEKYVEEILTSVTAATDKGEEAAVQVVTMMDQDAVVAVMARLDEVNPEVAARLRKNIFNFADISSLPLAARLAIFERVTTDKVIVALEGADGSIVESVLEVLGTRTRRMVEQELARGNRSPKKEIQSTRQEIVAVILQLLRDGSINRGEQAA